MILVSIKQSRIPNRVWLKFNNNSLLPFSLDDLVKLSLHSNQEISGDLYSKIINTSLTYLLTNYALRQVGMSAKTYSLILRKLKIKQTFYFKKYNLDKQLLTEDLPLLVANRAREQGLLNDTDFVRSYIARHPRQSRRQIEQALAFQGIKPTDIGPSILSKIDDEANIKKLILKKIKTPSDLLDIKTKNRITASIVRKGFSLSLVISAIDEIRSNL